MIETFTPLTRRLIALGLALLTILLFISVIVLPLIENTGEALQRLADVRQAVARMEMFKRVPAPPEIVPFPATVGISAIDIKAAHDRLAGYVAGQAAVYGLQLVLKNSAEGPLEAPTPISLEVQVTGDREPILKFIGALEVGRPQVRLMRYHLSEMPSLTVAPLLAPTQSAPMQSGANRQLSLDAKVAALWVGVQ